MKKIISVFLILLIVISCQKSTIVKPDGLINEDMMVDIIYDLSLLEVMKSNNVSYLESKGVNPNEYVYQKYKIDSLQFAKSDQYYATDIKNYKKIYDKVTQRLEEKTKLYDKTAASKSVEEESMVR